MASSNARIWRSSNALIRIAYTVPAECGRGIIAFDKTAAPQFVMPAPPSVGPSHRTMSPSAASPALPSAWTTATLLGRAWIPGRHAGPSPITVRPDGHVIDIAATEPTASAWLERDDLAAAIRAAPGTSI